MNKIKLSRLLDNKDLLEIINDPLYVVNKENKILYYNYQYINLTGLSLRELKEKNTCYDCFALDICKYRCVFQECAKQGQPVQLREVNAKDKEGNPLSFWVSAFPLFDDNEQVEAALVILRDMTVEAGVHSKYKNLYENERSAKIRLEELVKDRTLELRTANIKLQLINKKLEEFSIKDALTDLFNRRYFFEESEVIFEEARQNKLALSCLLIDVDFFKSANDNFSHQFGDFILHKLGTTIKYLLREEDVLARYGGDEFIVLLNNTSYSEALGLAKKINKKVKEKPFADSGFSKRITISIGVSSYPFDKIKSKDELVKFADEAMYKAKRSGRDAVFCYKDLKKRKT